MPRKTMPATIDLHADVDIDLDLACEQEEAAAFQSFRDRFHRSKRGNLWRRFDDRTLTVFLRNDGLFGVCIASADGPRWGEAGHVNEDDALWALARMLGVIG